MVLLSGQSVGFCSLICLLLSQDTAGQERFHALGPIYYRDSNGAILVYDVTDEDSFQKVNAHIKLSESNEEKKTIHENEARRYFNTILRILQCQNM